MPLCDCSKKVPLEYMCVCVCGLNVCTRFLLRGKGCWAKEQLVAASLWLQVWRGWTQIRTIIAPLMNMRIRVLVYVKRRGERKKKANNRNQLSPNDWWRCSVCRKVRDADDKCAPIGDAVRNWMIFSPNQRPVGGKKLQNLIQITLHTWFCWLQHSSVLT